jgi:hypothetical protein
MMLMKDLMRITNRYLDYFKVKDSDFRLILADDMYECQKKYGFDDQKIRSLDDATARQNWKNVAACMKYPKSMDEPFYILFKRPYLNKISECERYRLVFHELTHMVDYQDYARLNNFSSYEELFSDPQAVLFQNWSEYHAERRGYAAWLKHRYGIKLKHGTNRIDLMRLETANNIQFYGEQYTNTAEYGSARQIYFTMHLLARTSIWAQVLPDQVCKILDNDPFTYRGLIWIKKLMELFQKYPEIDSMNDHFIEIAMILAENATLTMDEMWEKTDELKLNPALFKRKFSH